MNNSSFVNARFALLLTVCLPLSACGGGGSSAPPPSAGGGTPTPSPTPTPTPTNTFPATGGECDGTAGWQAIADDGMDDTAAIMTSLQQAANKGDTLTIPAGTYNIDDPDGVSVVIQNQDFAIVATGAIFVAGPNVNSDLIDFDATSNSFSGNCGGSGLVNIAWTGGELDISRAHLSGTVPQGTSVGGTTTGNPVAGTTDGLSIRGATGGTSPRQKVDAVTITGLTIVGAPITEANRTAYLTNADTAPAVDSENDTWRNAGGDSGVFVMGARSALIEDSSFFGIRDASIYMSAAPYDASLGGNYVVRGNRFYGGFDGISSKRGAHNITMENNVFVNVVRATSLESLSQPLRDTNNQTAERIVEPVVISNNVFNGVQRAIQVESASNVTVSGNLIRNLGARVAQQNDPVRYSRYEGIVLEGVTNASIADNQIIGVDGARSTASTTVGITVGTHSGIVGPILSANVDVAASNVLTNLDNNVE
ncbi:right-handed parallel beta-helix repeat-containing protein [Altererythrobacter ishigakiensis]|uniref:Parallel beta helix pectate lyase-like protein n=1 Tax=Altererythrobacter ishigakiensis TaxID=476157 RepID=A0A562UM12_9SPHN|nr:right-handed parallel beta-helix repeat-containing protein [Altererythrobacter ishigakiensis]TWJ06654.1 parallel beta helix pectate lyase-like protein [Altererythrobacter ishigakiensis]